MKPILARCKLMLLASLFPGMIGCAPIVAEQGAITGFDVEYLQTDFQHIVKVLPDLVPGRQWLVIEAFGLGLLDEPSPGDIRFSLFHIGEVRNGAGPDSRGNIYLTAHQENGQKGIYVFNGATLSVSGFHQIDGVEDVSDIEMSSDQSKLYVVAAQWPVYDQPYDPLESKPDSGLVLELDAETLEVERRTAVGQEPEHIIVCPDGLIYVKTSQEITISTAGTEDLHYCEPLPAGTLTDAVRLDTFDRAKRFACGEAAGRFIKWSDDGSQFAQCNAALAFIPTKPEYDGGLWIFDSDVDAVVRTIKITDDSGNAYGVLHGTTSKVHPGIAYVSLFDQACYYSMQRKSNLPYSLMAIDMDSGGFLAGTKLDFVADYIYEFADGRLLALGPSNTIAIIVPRS